MTAKLKLIKDETKEHRYSELRFGRWLRQLGRRLFLMVSAGWLVGFVSVVIGTASKLIKPELLIRGSLTIEPGRVLQVVTIINFLVIFSVLLFPPRGPKAFTFADG